MRRLWRVSVDAVHRYVRHPDPLTEAGNWVAFLIGTHTPLWWVYDWAAAGPTALPIAYLTAASTPFFLVGPFIARWNGLAGRLWTLGISLSNTLFNIWLFGLATHVELFLAPCAALAAFLFHRRERWAMVAMTLLPLALWYWLQGHPPVPLQSFDAAGTRQLVILNVFSIGTLACAFGWLQVDIYQRMETKAQS